VAAAKRACDGTRRTAWTVYDRVTRDVVGVWIACCADSARVMALSSSVASYAMRCVAVDGGRLEELEAIERHPLA
jgi:hypothetical protein